MKRLWPAGLALIAFFAAAQERTPVVDVHVHVIGGRPPQANYGAALHEALKAMDESGIRTSVILPPPQVDGMPVVYDWREYASLLRQYPGRFAFLGGGGTLNVMLHEGGGTPDEAKLGRFERTALEILEAGAAGFGEIAAHHLSLQQGHPYEWVAPDHPLLLRLADLAAKHDAVIDLHLDLVPQDMAPPPRLLATNPATLKENAAAFERLLSHNRGAKIVWAHAGSHPVPTLNPERARRFLKAHPNLYMSIRVPGRQGLKPPPDGARSPAIMEPSGGVNPEWLAVLEEFPDRFVIGSDQFMANPGLTGGGHGMEVARFNANARAMMRRFLDQLPAELAAQIGAGNAMRLYKIPAGK